MGWILTLRLPCIKRGRIIFTDRQSRSPSFGQYLSPGRMIINGSDPSLLDRDGDERVAHRVRVMACLGDADGFERTHGLEARCGAGGSGSEDVFEKEKMGAILAGLHRVGTDEVRVGAIARRRVGRWDADEFPTGNTERVERHNTSLIPCVRAERIDRHPEQFPTFLLNVPINPLRIIINLANRRSRKDIVKLVEQYMFPQLINLFFGVRVLCTLAQTRERGCPFEVMHQNLRTAVALLDASMAGIHPAMELEVDLALPGG